MRASQRLVPPPEPPDLAERIRDELRHWQPPLMPVRGLPDPYGPDPLVFGVLYPPGPVPGPRLADRIWSCWRCRVTWCGGIQSLCWYCGKPASEI